MLLKKNILFSILFLFSIATINADNPLQQPNYLLEYQRSMSNEVRILIVDRGPQLRPIDWVNRTPLELLTSVEAGMRLDFITSDIVENIVTCHSQPESCTIRWINQAVSCGLTSLIYASSDACTPLKIALASSVTLTTTCATFLLRQRYEQKKLRQMLVDISEHHQKGDGTGLPSKWHQELQRLRSAEEFHRDLREDPLRVLRNMVDDERIVDEALEAHILC